MKYFKILSLLLFVIAFTSCDKECICEDSITTPSPVMGCIDVTAENFNAEAETDDGSCNYFVDPLLGNYIATDTCIYNPFPSQFDTAVFQYGFIIERLSNDELSFIGITQCEDTIAASVSPTYGLVIPSGASECLFNLIGQWNDTGTILTYFFPTSFGECKGMAVKQ